MFSFHKPKIYRSLNGCCICRAKSSSSRFTDSKRYEADFGKCFCISERRSGEICNACVLLVKRWKKLPPGSNRNWQHVVDARAGPGTKSMVKIRNRNQDEVLLGGKHKHKKFLRSRRNSQGDLSDDAADDISEHSNGDAASLEASDLSDGETEQDNRPKTMKGRRRKSNPNKVSSFLDLSFWKKTRVCCGVIYVGPNGAVLVDPSMLRPCGSSKSLHSKSVRDIASTGCVPAWQDESSCSSDMCSNSDLHKDKCSAMDDTDFMAADDCLLNDDQSLYESESSQDIHASQAITKDSSTMHKNNANYVSPMAIDEDAVLDLSLTQQSQLVPRPMCVQTEA